MCMLCVTPGDDGWGEPTEAAQPIPANRFEKVQRRAEAAGMVVGVYLTKKSTFPAPGEVTYLRFTTDGPVDSSLDQQLDLVETELTYWESR